jgi:hypothetical protein
MDHWLASGGTIQLRLQPRLAFIIFAVLSFLGAGLLAVQSVRIAGSQTLSASMTIPDQRRAAAMWSVNPEPHYRLGILELGAADHPDPAEARKQLQRAVSLSPASVAYWGQLAWACESAGDRRCADDALARVAQLAPMDPEAISLAANYDLVSGKSALALQQFGHLLELAPERSRDVFRILESAGYPASEIEPQVFAAGPAALVEYLSFLVRHNQVAQAQHLWNASVERARSGQLSLSPQLMAPYVNLLFAANLGQIAGQLRTDLASLNIFATDEVRPGDAIFNGGFEHAPTNNGFDWRRPSASYPVLDFFAPDGHNRGRSLRANFTVGLDQEFLLATQYVPLEPNASYTLSAWVRSDSITSDSGPLLRITDLACPECLNLSSATTVGTTSWHPVSVNFTTGPRTTVGKLEVVRPPGKYFPRDITGSFWLDDVSLAKTNPSAQEKP